MYIKCFFFFNKKNSIDYVWIEESSIIQNSITIPLQLISQISSRKLIFSFIFLSNWTWELNLTPFAFIDVSCNWKENQCSSYNNDKRNVLKDSMTKQIREIDVNKQKKKSFAYYNSCSIAINNLNNIFT